MSDLQSAGAGAPANGDPAGNTTCLCEKPPTQKVPIIFAPGVMGSRLHFGAANASWDPDDTGGWFGTGYQSAMYHWYSADADTKRKEMHYARAATVMGRHTDITDDEDKHGYSGVAESFYVAMLRHMRGMANGHEYNQHYDNPVYAVGYDWRQGNEISGKKFKEAAEGILAKEGAAQCIIVSHSMGGMVTRWAMKNGLEGKVLGAIHITQPVDGAVVMYRRCFTGAIEEMDPDGMGGKFDVIIGNDPIKYVTVSSGMPSAFQLLPTNNYKDEGKPWMHHKDGATSGDWSGDVYALYAGAQSPPGISPPGLANAAVLPDVRKNIRTAQSFHAGLDRYQHPKTKTIAGTGRVTDCSVLFNPSKQPADEKTTLLGVNVWTSTPEWKYQGLLRQAPAKGDGTVPHASANVLKASTDVTGIDHGAACQASSSHDVWEKVDGWIKEFLA